MSRIRPAGDVIPFAPAAAPSDPSRLRLAERIALLRQPDAAPAAEPALNDAAADDDLRAETRESLPSPGHIEPEPTSQDAASEARAVAVATELVTLIEEQRSLLEALARVTAEPVPAVAMPLPLPTEPPPLPLTMVLPPPPAIAIEAHDTAASHEPERPPIIIERAQADRLASDHPLGVAAFDPPSRLPGLLSGLGLALVAGALLYAWRISG
jgi:hypothetical protein